MQPVIHLGKNCKRSRHKKGSCATHVMKPRLPFSIFRVLDIWHDTRVHHWQEWLTFQPIMAESFLPSVVSSGLSITMSALVLDYWSGKAVLWVGVSSPLSLSDFSHPPLLNVLTCSSSRIYVQYVLCVFRQGLGWYGRFHHMHELLTVYASPKAYTLMHTGPYDVWWWGLHRLSGSQSAKTAHVKY